MSGSVQVFGLESEEAVHGKCIFVRVNKDHLSCFFFHVDSEETQ